jgi:hypothetical protein
VAVERPKMRKCAVISEQSKQFWDMRFERVKIDDTTRQKPSSGTTGNTGNTGHLALLAARVGVVGCWRDWVPCGCHDAVSGRQVMGSSGLYTLG